MVGVRLSGKFTNYTFMDALNRNVVPQEQAVESGLFGLLETKLKPSILLNRNSSICDGWSVSTNYSWHKGSRIWVLWKPDLFDIQFLSYSAQHIHMLVHSRVDDKNFQLTMIYAFNGLHERIELWNTLKEISATCCTPLLWLGDFNTVLSPIERLGGNTTDAEMEYFQDCVSICGMEDIPTTGSMFTWSNKQESTDRVYSRLDRAMRNQENADIGGKKTFKYFNMWGLAPSFKDSVAMAWASLALEHIHKALVDNPGDADLIQQEAAMAHELRDLVSARDSFLIQKAKVQWSLEGDLNTSYFHHVIKKRMMLNKVFQIEDQEGNLCTDGDSIQQAFLEPTSVKHFRPISCCNVLYKAISKIHCNRLALVLPDIISKNQGAFVKDQMLGALMFPEKFRQMIMTCVTTSSFTLNLNGAQFGYFKGRRGLRQGDPISPLLFCLCMEYLSRIMEFVTRKWYFRYHPLCKSLKLTHLLFADDLLMFSKGDVQSIMLILRVLATFSAASGLTVNASKSEIVSKVRGIGARKRSYAGRLVLINSVFNTLHNYWASIFLIPKGVIKRIEAICRNFLWCGESDYNRTPLVSWHDICFSKKEGGLGIQNAGVWNVASVGKLVHWLYTKADRLWVLWIDHVYMKGTDWVHYQPPPDSNWNWRNICRVRGILEGGYQGNTWIASPGGYTVSSGYHWMQGSHPSVLWMGICLSDKCVLCEVGKETHDHLFAECGYSARIIAGVEERLTLQLSRPEILVSRISQQVHNRLVCKMSTVVKANDCAWLSRLHIRCSFCT
ncbi:uncharacterized protein LOC141651462 [Silene latifolia]|uniref:uncharacterized protein LOC141651462 n=1 Tax=Silene latifolia TaxID=37657 RepID=UPI003D76DF2E